MFYKDEDITIDEMARSMREYQALSEEKCLMEELMKEELKKPPHLRQMAFYISCPCRKCSIQMLAY